MAAAEVYSPIAGVWTGPRGVVTDYPCLFNHQNTVATFNAIATGSGLLHAVIVDPAATGTIQIFDNTTAVAPIIVAWTIALAAGNPFSVILDVLFSTGLSMIIGVAASDVTLAFRQK